MKRKLLFDAITFLSAALPKHSEPTVRIAARQGKQLAKLVRWYTPAETLKMATSGNAELLALSGPRNPYPGKLGIIEEGALADLLLVNGNPLANLGLIADPAENIALINEGR